MRHQPGSTNLKPDLCVIGGGTAGSAIALAAAAMGLSCVLVEKSARLGRSQAADLAEDMLIEAGRATARSGARPTLAESASGFAALRRRIGASVTANAAMASTERLRSIGVQVLTATGRFIDPRTVKADATTIRARRFVIATGARPIIPTIDGIDLIRATTVHSLAALDSLPARLAVLGHAPAAYELAQAFGRLGSEVLLVPGAAPPLPDPELMGGVEAGLRGDGVRLENEALVDRLQPRGTGVDVVLGGQPGGEPFRASHLLLAAGLSPFLESLGLEAAGVRATAGALSVGADLRTTNRRVFAIGDVLGGIWPATPAIPVQVGLVLRAAYFRQPVRFVGSEMPRVLRTSPAVAVVGSTETELRGRSGPVRIFRWPLAATERAIATGQTGGHVKIVATPGGAVLGAGIVGARAEELIAPWGLALAHGVRLDRMASMATVQPSLGEASRRAALTHVAERLRRPAFRRLLGALRFLG